VARPRREPSKATPLPSPPASAAAAPAAAARTTWLLRAAIFGVEIGQWGKLFGEAVGIFFLKMELIRLYVCIVKRFSCFSQKKCTILNS
jgi:hypothetical protein